MAIYMCSIKVIKRSEGKSIVAAAAYRAGDKIENEWDGVTHDYTNKNWISHTEIMLPQNAPVEYKDRSNLWNSVEKSEKSSDARLGKEVLIALPREMNLNEQIKLVQDFVQNTFVNDGMCADISIHNPPLKNDLGQPIDYNGNVLNDPSKYIFQNPHAHILITIRPIDKNGKWEGKSSVEYICKNASGEEKAFTALELKKYKHLGWEKQYKYMDGKNKRWLTFPEGESLGLTRTSRAPKTSTHGRQNPTVARWESPRTIYKWRKSWEDIANRHLISNGYTTRIDSRSYIKQGKDNFIPKVHLGPEVSNMVKRANRKAMETGTKAIYPELANLNEEIEQHNQLVLNLTKEINVITEKIKEISLDASQNIQELKTLLYKKRQEQNTINKLLLEKESKLIQLQQSIILLNDATQKIRQKNIESEQTISQYRQQLNSLKFFDRKTKATLTEKLNTEITNIETRNQYLSSLYLKNNITSATEINRLINECSEIDAEAKELNSKLAICVEQLTNLTNDYNKLVKTIAENRNKKTSTYHKAK